MTIWEEIRDEVAGMLADGKPLEDVIGILEKRKNEMAKANLLKAMDDMKKREQTNEEWFCGLATEEKAEKLTDFSFWLVPTIPTEDKREQIRKKIADWLKQPKE